MYVKVAGGSGLVVSLASPQRGVWGWTREPQVFLRGQTYTLILAPVIGKKKEQLCV